MGKHTKRHVSLESGFSFVEGALHSKAMFERGDPRLNPRPPCLAAPPRDLDGNGECDAQSGPANVVDPRLACQGADEPGLAVSICSVSAIISIC
jgi:hypothetical protein